LFPEVAAQTLPRDAKEKAAQTSGGLAWSGEKALKKQSPVYHGSEITASL